MIYENITYNDQWIVILNISYSVFLAILFGFSFLRTWFFSKRISKSYCLNNHMSPEKNGFSKKIFAASFFSEILTYVYFCIIFEIKFSDYPTIPIVNGLSIIVWNYDNRLEGIVKLLIGMLIWVALCVAANMVLLSKLQAKIPVQERAKIGMSAALKNIPFYFIYQIFLALSMMERTEELHSLQL